MYLEKKVHSVRYALSGLRIAWREEISFRIQVFIAIIAVPLGLFLRIPSIELLIILFMIGFVLAAEALNTALEELCDKFQPEQDPRVAKIKDLAAAAVFVAALTALVVGCVIFIPPLLQLLNI